MASLTAYDGIIGADYDFCGGWDTGCATTSCCIYVSSTKCGARISVNS